MMKFTVKCLPITLLFMAYLPLFAQNNSKITNSPAQITFAYPIGTHGLNAPNYANNVSINVLFGVNGGVNGFELASLCNVNKGDVQGIQIAGVANVNDNQKGLQLAGIINVNKGSSEGVQIGIVNVSKKMKGVQLGLLNISENTSNHIPIGLLNIVKNGYYDVEMVGGDVIYANLTYKMGVEKLYNIYKLGSSFTYKNKPVYSFGLGIGTLFTLNPNNKISLDATANQIIYDGDWSTKKVNILNKLDLNYRHFFTPKVSVLLGPSFNVYYTEQKVVDGNFGTLNVPYEFSTIETVHHKTSLWVGFNLGLSYKFQ
jgi:predicted NUDIX family phosphoesterase